MASGGGSNKAPFQSVGESFVAHYYQNFDTNRANLAPLYRDNSMLSFEGEQFMGIQPIIQKLVSLPFQKVVHQIVTCDCQPVLASQPNGILVFVSGNLVVDDSPNPMKFSQTFNLLSDPSNPNSYFVHNDLFRLNYG
uniref:NTF2-related export protein n=1 Tax=Timspurckia oligopyrenoides TaxID=708627 RepID=A0A7S0ZAF8_9RHOD|mmetsp:Transcript_10227/g.18424  ORF Transcript_10227/g.18424 Transcript_10227/m.18424 type:complete len:137 (+) Transcript_10227:75-485(+)